MKNQTNINTLVTYKWEVINMSSEKQSTSGGYQDQVCGLGVWKVIGKNIQHSNYEVDSRESIMLIIAINTT